MDCHVVTFLAYVWSLDLIPMFARLNQTIEGLFKIASSSLSYATLLHDSYVQNIKALKRRRDVVFSQAVSKCMEIIRMYLRILLYSFAAYFIGLIFLYCVE